MPRQGVSTQEMEHDKFVDAPNDQQAVLVESPDVTGKKIVERFNANITFIGRAPIDAETNEAKWQIAREFSLGNTTETKYLSEGNYDQVWDDRASLFGALPDFANTISTYFDGVNDYVDLGDNFNFTRLQPWTMSFWIRPQQAQTETIYSKEAANTGIRIIKDANNKLRVYIRSTSVNLIEITSVNSVNQLTFNHVVITYDGSSTAAGVKGYINGVETAFTVQFNTLTTEILNSAPAKLGTALSGSLWYKGHIDEVSIWNNAMSQANINLIYNGGEPVDLVNHPLYSDLISYYHMGDLSNYPTIPDEKDGNDGTMINMSGANFEEVVP